MWISIESTNILIPLEQPKHQVFRTTLFSLCASSCLKFNVRLSVMSITVNFVLIIYEEIAYYAASLWGNIQQQICLPAVLLPGLCQAHMISDRQAVWLAWCSEYELKVKSDETQPIRMYKFQSFFISCYIWSFIMTTTKFITEKAWKNAPVVHQMA